MAITAKRFSFLNNETNLPTADFSDITTSDIHNSVNNEISKVIDAIDNFVTTSYQNSQIEERISQLGIEDNIRQTKDIITGIKDLTDISTNDLNDLVYQLIPDNPEAQNLFGQLNSQCKKRAMNKGGIGRPFDPNFNCNSRSRNSPSGYCNQSTFAQLLNNLTGDSAFAIFKDLNGVLMSLLELAILGYDMNMCGVFNALTNGETDFRLLNRLAGGVLSVLSNTSNTNGVLDLANAVATKSLKPLLEYPAGIMSSLDNFSISNDYKENDYGDLYDSTMGAMEIYKTNWDKSDINLTKISTKEFNLFNNKLNTVMKSKVMNSSVDENDLSTPPSIDDNFIYSAYHLKQFTLTT